MQLHISTEPTKGLAMLVIILELAAYLLHQQLPSNPDNTSRYVKALVLYQEVGHYRIHQ